MRIKLKPEENSDTDAIAAGLSRVLKCAVMVDRLGRVYVWRRGLIWYARLPQKVLKRGATEFSLRLRPLGGPRCQFCKKSLLNKSEIVYLNNGRQGHKKCLDRYVEAMYGPFDTGGTRRK